MINALKIQLFFFLILSSFFAQANLTVKKNFGGFTVTGTTDGGKLYIRPGPIGNSGVGFMRINIYKINYFYRFDYPCSKDKDQAVNSINNILSRGAYFSEPQGPVSDSNNYLYIACKYIGDPGERGFWESYQLIGDDEIKTSETVCNINSASTEIDFGTILQGTSGQSKETNIGIFCDKDARVTINIKNTINGIIPAGDAKIATQFDNNKITVSGNIKKQITSYYPLHLRVQETGTTTGFKRGNIILEASWD